MSDASNVAASNNEANLSDIKQNETKNGATITGDKRPHDNTGNTTELESINIKVDFFCRV